MAQQKTEVIGVGSTLLFRGEYDWCGWGWWCPSCSTRKVIIRQEGFKSRDSARRAAAKHLKRRGHR